MRRQRVVVLDRDGCHLRPRWTRRALLCGVAALGLSACGGGTKAKHAGRLPARAKVVFASDRPASAAPAGNTSAGGRVVASLGFNPTVDGFSFENYGFVAGTDLDQHAMRELFGDSVCATAPSDSCTLTPLAQQWAQSRAPDMWGGHCYGFSMTALRFFRHLLSQSQFGGTTTYSLSLTPSLQSEIAYAWVTQELTDVVNTWQLESGPQMVSFLEDAFSKPRGEVYSLGIRNYWGGNSDGHVITPIGVKDMGGGHYEILVYDNNFPGETRYVSIDENNSSWSYDMGGGEVWKGKGGDSLSDNPMIAEPLSATLRRHPAPWSGPFGSVNTISLGGDPAQHGHLLITTSGGQRLGYFHGRFVNQIKGARVVQTYLNQDWKAVPEPIYEVPARDRMTITLEPSRSRFPQQVNVSGPGFGATVSNLYTGSSSAIQMTLGGGGRLGVRAVGQRLAAAPQIELTGGAGRAGNRLVVTPRSLLPGAQLVLSLTSAAGRGSVTSSTATSGVSLTLEHVGPAGTRIVQRKTLRLAPARPASF